MKGVFCGGRVEPFGVTGMSPAHDSMADKNVCPTISVPTRASHVKMPPLPSELMAN